MKTVYKVRTTIAQYVPDEDCLHKQRLHTPTRGRSFGFLPEYEINDEVEDFFYIEEYTDDPRDFVEGICYWKSLGAAEKMRILYDFKSEVMAVTEAAAERAWARRKDPRYSEMLSQEPIEIDFSQSPEQLVLGI